VKVDREELAPGLVVEWWEPTLLSTTRRLRLRVVFAMARLMRVPIAIRDEFYDPTAAVGYTSDAP
jgi:hypothetical protein